jgi:O-antigen ligase
MTLSINNATGNKIKSGFTRCGKKYNDFSILNKMYTENILILITLLFALIPLSLNVCITTIYFWNIPFFLLLSYVFMKKFYSGNILVKNIDFWEINVFLFLLFLVLFTLRGENFYKNWPHFVQFCIGFLLAVFCRRQWGKSINIKLLCHFSLLAIGIESSIGLLQILTNTNIGNFPAYFGQEQYVDHLKEMGGILRVVGTFDHHNTFGSMIVCFFPFLFLNAFQNKYLRFKILSFIIWPLASIAVICLVFTYSAASLSILFFFSILISFVILAKMVKQLFLRTLYYRRFPMYLKSKKVLAVIFAIFIVILTTFTFQKKINDAASAFAKRAVRLRITEMATDNRAYENSSAGFRLELWKGAIQHFAKHPFVGVGFQNSANIWSSVEANLPPDWDAGPHNVYLTMAVEGGVVVFIHFLIITAMPFLRMLKNRDFKNSVWVAFFFSFIAVIGFCQVYMLPILPSFQVFFMLILGCTMGYCDEFSKKISPYKLSYTKRNK